MALLPPSTNAEYKGPRIAAWFLVLSGLLELVPGCIHYFIPVRAATRIAHIALGANTALVVDLFTWEGSVQIPFGLALILVALRYRALVPMFLFFNLLERLMMSLAAWVFHPSSHHPPEHFGSPISVVLLTIFFCLSLTTRRTA